MTIADFCKGCWNPKQKIGVTTHFLGIHVCKLQFGEKFMIINKVGCTTDFSDILIISEKSVVHPSFLF